MSNIKLDPTFRREQRGPRVGGFEPPPPPVVGKGSTSGLVFATFLCAVVGAAVVCAYHWLALEF